MNALISLFHVMKRYNIQTCVTKSVQPNLSNNTAFETYLEQKKNVYFDLQHTKISVAY